MTKRQKEEGKLLHTFVRSRTANRAEVVFITLTQMKLPVEHESATQAIDRIQAARHALMNTKTKRGRTLRKYFDGGVWFMEVSYSRAGRKPWGYTAETGWHAHLHGLAELNPPPSGIGPDEWYREAKEAIIAAWLELNPECNAAAQDVRVVNDDAAGQVCKYPLKPFELQDIPRLREALKALVGRRTHNAWGSWRSWKRLAQRILGETEGPKLQLGRQTLGGLLNAAELATTVDFEFWLKGEQVSEAVSAQKVLKAVRKDPRTFEQKDAIRFRPGAEDASRSPPRGGSPALEPARVLPSAARR